MLSNYWYIIYQTKKLGKSPVKVTLFGDEIVLFRSHDNIVALEDRCAHRNAPLSDGHVHCGKIICPYHGWQYNDQGEVSKIPSEENQTNSLISIKKYNIVEQDGFIWITFNTDINTTPPKILNYKEKGWTSFLMITDFPAPVDACLENFLDCPHATTVHNKWFRSSTSKVIEAELRINDDGSEVEYFEEPRKKSAVWTLLNRKKAQMKHIDRFIAPSTSKVDYIFSDNCHYTITSFCTPITENKTRVFTIMNYKAGRLSKLIRIFFEPLSRIILKQDLRIIEKQQETIKKFGKEKFTVIKSDLLLPSIRQWRNSLAKGEKPKLEKKNTNFKIRL